MNVVFEVHYHDGWPRVAIRVHIATHDQERERNLFPRRLRRLDQYPFCHPDSSIFDHDCGLNFISSMIAPVSPFGTAVNKSSYTT
jgi:hypothetical protein